MLVSLIKRSPSEIFLINVLTIVMFSLNFKNAILEGLVVAVIELGPGLDNSSSEHEPPLLCSNDFTPPPPSPPAMSLEEFLHFSRLPPPPPPPLPSISTNKRQRLLWALKHRPSLYEDYWFGRIIRKPTQLELHEIREISRDHLDFEASPVDRDDKLTFSRRFETKLSSFSKILHLEK